MINIEKVIDEYNENHLEDKLSREMTKEQLRKEFQSKLHEGEGTKVEVSTNADYMRVLDGNEDKLPEGETTISSTNGESYTINLSDNKGISCMEIPSEGLNTTVTTINTTDLYEYAIKEHDQVRNIKFKANSLLEQLNLPLLEEDKDIELKCLIEGRNCDRYGNAVNIDYE